MGCFVFNRPLIAIDIGTSSIKMIELGGRHARELRAIGLETLPPGTVVDGTIQDVETVERIIRELLKKLKIITTGRRAAIAVGGNGVIIKRVNVDTSKGTELAEQIFYEAEQHFQHDMADLYFDYHELQPANKESTKKPVLLVGAKREVVELYIAAVRGAGLRVGVVDTDVFSVSNMFEHNFGMTEGLVGLVNIGATITQVSLVWRGQYLYTRDIAMGGQEYTRQMVDQMKIDRDNAESLKISASQGDGSVPAEAQKIFSSVNDQLVSEIKSTIEYFFSGGEMPVETGPLQAIFVTGGGSKMLGLDAAIAATMGTTVKILNPFHRIDVNPRKFQLDYLLMQGHLYGVAVGLGLRGIGDRAA